MTFDFNLATLIPVGFSVVLAWALHRVSESAKSKDRKLERLAEEFQAFKLAVAKDYYSAEQGKDVVAKLDKVIEELHKQNVTLTEVRTELKAHRPNHQGMMTNERA